MPICAKIRNGARRAGLCSILFPCLQAESSNTEIQGGDGVHVGFGEAYDFGREFDEGQAALPTCQPSRRSNAAIRRYPYRGHFSDSSCSRFWPFPNQEKSECLICNRDKNRNSLTSLLASVSAFS
jgi:hypothetical protein